MDLKIRIEPESGWLPDVWFEDSGMQARGGYGGGDLLDVDWEAAFGKMGVGVGVGEEGGKGKGKGGEGWDPMVF